MNPARKTLVAKTKFHGRSGSGYATDNISISGTNPLTTPAVICAFKTVKLYNTS